MAFFRAGALTMCPESFIMSKATQAPELHLLPQVMLQLIPTLFTEHQCTYLKTK